MKTPANIFDVYGSENIYEPVRAVIENDRDPGLVFLIAPEVFREEFTQELFENYRKDFDERAEKIFNEEATRLFHLDDEKKPLSFASEKLTEIIIASVRDYAKVTIEHADKLPIRAVVVLWPWENDELKYLPKFSARYPQIPVYILWPNRTQEDGTFHAPGVFPRGSSVTLFDTWDQFEATEGIEPIIEGIVNVGETVGIGALPKENKTWLMLSAAKALLTSKKFLGHFNVVRPAEKVVYFAVETSRGLIKHRLKILGIYDFIREGKLLVRTLSAGSVPDLTDPVILEVVKGADVFLDTAIRFSEGDENSAGDAKILSAKVQGLIAAGARVVWIAHHAPKSFREATTMTLENMLRGSGDFAASISSAIGLRQLDEKTNTIFVQGVASRDMEPVEPFVICGRPHLNETGDFLMVKKPGQAGVLGDHVGKAGRHEDPAKQEKFQMVLNLAGQGKSQREIADQVGVSKTTVQKWIQDSEKPEF